MLQVLRQRIPGVWTNHSKTSLLNSRCPGRWNNQVATRCRVEKSTTWMENHEAQVTMHCGFEPTDGTQ